MAYTDLLDNELADAQFLVVLSPRRQVSTWTLDSGAIYTNAFTFGQVISVTIDGTELTEVNTSSLSPGEWFYDVTNQIIYVRDPSDGDPNGKFVVVTYELYVSTLDEHWHRLPTDSSTRTVYFEPVINRSVSLKASIKDIAFGILPTFSTNLVLNNAEGFFERHVFDSSFNQAPIAVYHSLKDSPRDDPDVDNIKLIFNGTVNSAKYSDEVLTLKARDRVDVFNKDFFNGNTENFTTSDFSNLEPNQENRPIRTVYGRVDGFVPVNIDYNADQPTTSDNREWVCISGQSDIHNLTSTVDSGSTATATVLIDATGWSIGDTAYFNRAVGTDEYLIITDVNYGTNTLTHSALSGGAMAASDTVERSFVGNIQIVQDGEIFRPLYNRDYTTRTNFNGTSSGFEFDTSLESNLGMPRTLSPGDIVTCRVYGQKNSIVLGGSPFGSNDSELGNLTNPIVILFDLLKNKLSIPESDIDTATFTSLEALVDEPIGFSAPETKTANQPNIKKIIEQIIQTLLLKIYLDRDAKWTLQLTGILGPNDYEVQDDELISSLDYNFEYNDIYSETRVNYRNKEQDVETEQNSKSSLQVRTNRENTTRLHTTDRAKEFDSLHIFEDNAQSLSDKLASIFGERRGEASIKVKSRFFNAEIGEVVRVTRTRMPGFTFDDETEQSRDFIITGFTKTLTQITLELDDQKGIEDNPGDF